MQPYIGAIFSFGFNFAPQGWNFCDGTLLSIAEYTALYSLIGTTYGGDGSTSFAVPNLQGRVPIGDGQGPGLSNYVIGQAAGNESITLLATNLPAHSHPVSSILLPVSATTGELNDPTNAYFGQSNSVIGDTYFPTGGVAMAANPVSQTGITGSNMPVNILNPYLVVNYCIALEGLFPSRP